IYCYPAMPVPAIAVAPPESHRLTRRPAVPQNTLQAAQTKAKSIRSRRLGLVHEIHYQHAEPA
ncbi:MAG: hypothetical protein PVF34_12335, partial [Gammaproteobacteria bacterium]